MDIITSLGSNWVEYLVKKRLESLTSVQFHLQMQFVDQDSGRVGFLRVYFERLFRLTTRIKVIRAKSNFPDFPGVKLSCAFTNHKSLNVACVYMSIRPIGAQTSQLLFAIGSRSCFAGVHLKPNCNAMCLQIGPPRFLSLPAKTPATVFFCRS